MSQSHISSQLPLRKFSVPVDPEHTAALFHFDVTQDESLSGTKSLGVHPDDDDIIGYWDFSQEQNVALDLSGNDYHGVLEGSLSWSNGIQGKSINFTGVVGNNINCGNILQLGLEDRTYVIWYKLNATTHSEDHYVLTKTNTSSTSYRQALGFRENGNLYIVFTGSGNTHNTLDVANPKLDTNWHQLAWVIDRSDKYHLYQDSALVGSVDISTHAEDNFSINVPFRIGSYHSSTGSSLSSFNGCIASVAIYNRVLSSDEIKDIYNQSVATLRQDGRYGGCVAVEEATTNQVTNGGATNETGSWLANQTGHSIEIVETDKSLTGSAFRSYLPKNTNTSTPGWYQDVPVTAGVVHSLTALVRPLTLRGMIVNVRNGPSYSYGSLISETFSGPDQWQMVSYQFTPTNSAVRLTFFHEGGGEANEESDIMFSDVQIEKKQFSTSFVNGSRMHGRLQYPNPIPDASEFTISFWGKLGGKHSDNGSTETLISICPEGANHDSIAIDYENQSTLRFFTYNSIGQSQVASKSGYIRSEVMKWNYYTITRDGSNLIAYLNGIEISRVANSGSVKISGNLMIGDRYFAGVPSTRRSNILIDELRIENRAISAEEVYAWYISGSPHFPRGIHRVFV